MWPHNAIPGGIASFIGWLGRTEGAGLVCGRLDCVPRALLPTFDCILPRHVRENKSGLSGYFLQTMTAGLRGRRTNQLSRLSGP